MEQLKEDCRDARSGHFVETLWHDVRHGVRVLQKNPGFAAAAILTLALGTGVNTALFSVVYGVLLRPLPYSNGERLVVLHQKVKGLGLQDVRFTPTEIADYRDHCKTLSTVVEHHQMQFLIFGSDTAEQVNTAVVSANFFDVLGVKPVLGRTFRRGEDKPDGDAVLILSYKYWQSHQSGDPKVVGKVFQMNNRAHTVIGVLPPIPQYPSESDVYMPVWQCPFRSNPNNETNREGFRNLTAFGILKPGVQVQQANADLAVIARRFEADYPEVYKKSMGYGIEAIPLADDLAGRARTTFLVLLGGAGFVLLIACANVANLVLSRMLKLQREIAIRAALGASRVRLARQLMTESVVLSIFGGIAGLALAPAALRVLVSLAEKFTTRASEVRIDAPVLGFAFLISIVTGLLLGIASAASIGSGADALKSDNGRTTSSRRSHRLRSALVVGQVAVSLTLLIAAGLMIRSFLRLQQVDPGFKPDSLLTLRINPSFSHYDTQEKRQILWEKVLRNVAETTRVESVALASNIPFHPTGLIRGPGSAGFEVEGKLVSGQELKPTVDVRAVSSAYLDTIRQPLVKGRGFTEHDKAGSLPVVLVNQTLARLQWPSEDPVGKRVTFDRKAWITVVGVVGDVKEYGLERPVGQEMYFPLRQSNFAGNLLVRTSAEPLSISQAVQGAIRAIDPHIAVDQVTTMARLQYDSVSSPRLITMLLGLFAGLALLISASGIASVMALTVSQRTHEFGIRMALGAKRSSVVSMVVGKGLILALVGVALGACGALAVTRGLSSLLYDTSPTDGLTFLLVSLLFLVVAALACFIPARQVTGIDPVIALRQE